jgi:hypothetical protein
MSFTVRGPTRIPAGELREAELTWYSVGERGGIDREPLDGDFHLRVEAKIRAGLRRPVALPDGTKVRRCARRRGPARAMLTALFEEGYAVEEH